MNALIDRLHTVSVVEGLGIQGLRDLAALARLAAPAAAHDADQTFDCRFLELQAERLALFLEREKVA